MPGVEGGPGRAEPGQPETERQCPCRVPECRGWVGRGKAKFPSPHSPGPAEGGGAWSPADDTPARFQTSPGLPVVAAPHVLAPGRLAVTSHLLLSSRQLPAGCRHVPGLFLAGGQRARGPHDCELAFPGVKSGGGGQSHRGPPARPLLRLVPAALCREPVVPPRGGTGAGRRACVRGPRLRPAERGRTDARPPGPDYWERAGFSSLL